MTKDKDDAPRKARKVFCQKCGIILNLTHDWSRVPKHARLCVSCFEQLASGRDQEKTT